MRNINKELIQAIIYRLSGFNVVTVDLDDIKYPYVKIQDITLSELPNKYSMYYYGTVSIAYRDLAVGRYYDTNNALDDVNTIEGSLRQSVSDVLLDGMVYFKLINNTGVVTAYDDSSVHSAVLTYSFKINSEQTFIDRVQRDGGIDECIL